MAPKTAAAKAAASGKKQLMLGDMAGTLSTQGSPKRAKTGKKEEDTEGAAKSTLNQWTVGMRTVLKYRMSPQCKKAVHTLMYVHACEC